MKKLRQSAQDLLDMLTANEEVCLVHCAAGIHRTGIFAYTLLRLLGGLSQKEGYAALKDMRIETFKGVENWRIELAEKELVTYFRKEAEKTKPADAIAEGDEDEEDSDNN